MPQPQAAGADYLYLERFQKRKEEQSLFPIIMNTMDCLYGSSVDSVYKILFWDIAMLDGQKQGVRTGKANSFYDFRESFQLRLFKKKSAFKYWPSEVRVPLGCLPGSSKASTFLPNRPPSPF